MPNGNWIAPTVFSGVDDHMTISREEIFGPIMSVLVFDSEEEVIGRANNTQLGLAAGIFTRDIGRAHRVASKLQAGTCWINTYGFSPIEFPFGGMKESGVGRECARDALLHYTATKSIYVENSPFESVF
jgi:betaine-aldehyde dehydrogenase